MREATYTMRTWRSGAERSVNTNYKHMLAINHKKNYIYIVHKMKDLWMQGLLRVTL